MSASTSKPSESLTKVNEQTREEDSQPTLGVLEEDDEFEEFEAAGRLIVLLASHSPVTHHFAQIGMIHRQTWHI